MRTLKYKNVAIVGLARDEAPEVVTSAAIEDALAPTMKRLKLPKGTLAGLTGINSRRFYPLDLPPSQAAAAAAEKLFSQLAFDREKLDLLYSTSVCRDHIEPSTASIVQARLGLDPQVKSLDIGNACLGFMDGMELAAIQIEAGLVEYALIVAGENSRPVNEATLSKLSSPESDFKTFFKNFATLTLGSGGAALILGPRDKHPGSPQLTASVSLSDTSTNHMCRGDQSGMETDSVALMVSGVALGKETFNIGIKAFGWTPNFFDHLICHQVSQTNIKKFCEALGLNENILVKTFPNYGNMGPVAVPFTLDMAIEKNLIKKGNLLGLMGIGSGLCSMMMEVKW